MVKILKVSPYVREGVWYVNSWYITSEGVKDRLRFSTGFLANRDGKRDKYHSFLVEKGEELVRLYIAGKRDHFFKNYEKYRQKNNISFKNVVNRFLEEEGGGLKPKSKKTLIERLRPSVGFFDLYCITDIDRNAVEEYFDFLDSKNISSITKKHYAKAFNRVIKYATDNDLISKNPFKMRRWISETNKITPFNEDEIYRLLKADGEEISTYLKIALLCGARTGEILALQWKHVDLKAGKLHIMQSISESGLHSCKTANSQRVIDILPPLLEHLKELRERVWKMLGQEGEEKFIFQGERVENIKNFHKSYLKVQYVALLSKLSIPYRPIYNTRHSFASFMLGRGENLIWVSWMLGHKNSQITLNSYTRYIKSGEHAKFLNNFLGGVGDESRF